MLESQWLSAPWLEKTITVVRFYRDQVGPRSLTDVIGFPMRHPLGKVFSFTVILIVALLSLKCWKCCNKSTEVFIHFIIFYIVISRYFIIFRPYVDQGSS